MTPLIVGLCCLGALALAAAALGRRLLRVGGVRLADPLECGVAATALGLGALQALPFALLAAGCGGAAAFRIAACVLAAALAPDAIAVVRSAARQAPGLRPRSAVAWMLAITGACLLLAMFLRAVCPQTDADGLSYHLAAVVRCLQAGRFVFVPTLTYTNWPIGVEMLFTLLRGVAPGAPPAVAQFVLGVTAACGALLIARRCGRPGAVAITACLLFAYAVFWEEMSLALVDLGGACFATTAALCLMAGLGEPDGRTMALSAVLAGFAATTKLLCVWDVMALALVLVGLRWRFGRRAAIAAGARYAGTGLLIVAPWLARAWVLAGNPVYPLFYNVFGGREWTAGGMPRMQQYFLLMNRVPGVPQTTAGMIATRVAMIAVMLTLFAWIVRRTNGSPAAAPARFACLAAAFIFAGSGYNLRFLMSAYPAAMAGIGAGLAGWRPRAAAVLCWLAPLLALRCSLRCVDLPVSEAAMVATGRTTADAFLTRRLPDYPVVQYANRSLPAGSRILVSTWEEDTTLYRAPAYRANYWLQDSVHYETRERLLADLRRLGITHLVLRPMGPGFCERSAVCMGRRAHETAALDALAAERGRVLYRSGDIALLSLRLSN